MTQLQKLKVVLGNPSVSDDLLNFCLDNASEIICNLRNSNIVENEYLNAQIKIATEIFNKQGAEGEIVHTENGIIRQYEKGDISSSLLSQITPIARTPFSTVRIIVE